jgi:hypothetical protein
VSGQLNKNIIKIFKLQFEDNCISLLLEGYNAACGSAKSYTEDDENEITVKLVGLMRANDKSRDYKIDIVREYYLDDDANFSGNKHPDTSPRIDIRFMNWSTEDKFEYFIEAKNLAENDWIKNTNASVNANGLRKRYVETGIHNFISGKYKNGCLIGYVLEGNPDAIVRKINDYLTKKKRPKEHLSHSQNHGFVNNYSSEHLGSCCELLQHFLFEFK